MGWHTLFFRLPRLTALSILLIIAAGAAALSTLGRQEDPTLVQRIGRIVTLYPGADAARVEALVSRQIEAELLELPEIAEVYSTSRANVSVQAIFVREDLSPSEVEEAWTLIREKIDSARSAFPDGVEQPELRRIYIGASTLVAAINWNGEAEPELAVMSRLAADLEERFRTLAGTEETSIHGEALEEIRVAFDTEALAAAGLNLRQAANLIARSDSRTPVGQIDSEQSRLSMEVAGAFDSLARVRAVPLVNRPDGSALRVGDLAEVSRTLEDPPRQLALRNNQRVIYVAAYIEPGVRVDRWAERARGVVTDFSASLGGQVGVDIAFDQSVYTRERLEGLAINLAQSALIVLVVLFVFMGWRAAIVVGSALPLTIAIVLACFSATGIPLHQMSVTGLIMALGLLIDNAIVVADEYEQRRLQGIERSLAIEASLRHLTGPLFASTLTTALAFAPIAMMPGTAGEFIGTMGLSVIFAVVGSFVVAIFIVPALAGRMDRPRAKRALDKGPTWWRDGLTIDALSDGYRWTLDGMLRAPLIPIALTLALAGLGGWLGTSQPLQFFPATERDQFQVELLMPEDTPITVTEAAARRMTDLLLARPGVREVNLSLGEGAPPVYYNVLNPQTDYSGFAAGWIQTNSPQDTRRLVGSIQTQLRETFPQAQILTLPFEQGPPVDSPISLTISGPDLGELTRLGEEARRILANVPGVTFTRSSLLSGAPTLILQAGEAESQLAGARLADLAGALNAQLEGVPAGSLLEGVEEVPVRVLGAQATRSDLGDLRATAVGSNAAGSMGTPLSALGPVTLEPRTSAITRLNGERVTIIAAWLDPFTLPAPAFAEYLRRLDAEGFRLPAGYTISAGGEAEERGEATSALAASALPLLILMAGAVTLVFNSFRIAMVILLTGALCIPMGFLALWLFDLPMGFTAIVGALGLFGIAINGAIVVLSALMASPQAMAGDRLARREVIMASSRHIVATTLTTVGGFLPIILGGDTFWLPLATTIAVGVGFSAILGLYFAPALFFLPGIFPRKRAALSGHSMTTNVPAETLNASA